MNNFKELYEAKASLSKIDYAIYDGMKYRLIVTEQKIFS